MIKYLYIDDESDSANSYKSEVERGSEGLLNIVYSTPKTFDNQINALMNDFEQYDGLILDWCLDSVPQEDGRISFRAGALAQEIRTRGSERTEKHREGLKELPIVLWSTRGKLDRSFYGDNTSNDLFDYVHDKETDLASDTARRVPTELIALADGYKTITSLLTEPFYKLLGLASDKIDFLDPRFLEYFDPEEPCSVHDVARFILKQAVLTPGVLINDRLLAVRLGIDIDRSPDWMTLLGRLPEHCKYRGPFNQAWPRWWTSLIQDEWWFGISKGQTPSLGSLTAEQRVERLRERLGLDDLFPAEPIANGYSPKFQTISVISGKPLDPRDGVLLGGKQPLPWQEASYISRDEALGREYESRTPPMRLHPLEVERVRLLRRTIEPDANG